VRDLFSRKWCAGQLEPLINNMLTLWGSRISKAAPDERTMRRYVTRWAAAWLRVQPK
jgi:hypothetical protein